MNRLLNVFQNAAIVHASNQGFHISLRCSNYLSSFHFVAAFIPRSWLSTAVATSADDLQPGGAGVAPSDTTRSPLGRTQQPAPAVNPSATSCSSPSPASPATSLPPAQIQPQEHDGLLPVVPVFEDEALAAQLQQPQPVQLLQVVPTPEGAPRDKLLIRDFIQNSLYHPTLGYFNAPTPPVGSVGGPINYWRIYCRDEFNILVSKKYQELETSFLTPAELFSPWYGACIARHIVEHRRHHLAMEGQPLLIVEVGGGNGTLARDILDWLRDNRPQDYRQTSYTCLEISTSLAARQYDKVVRQGGHGGRFHLRRGSGLDPATWGPERRWEHTFVLMMEVLDNLPHDRVFRRRASDPWQQTVVRPAETDASPSSSSAPSQSGPPSSPSSMERGPWQLVGEPLSDPLLRRTLSAVYRAPTREQQLDDRFNRVLDFILARDSQPGSRDEVLWLPTACAAFLELLHDLRPNHSLIAADFDKLPDVRLPGRNAPLVAQKVGGRNIDHDTIFVPWGTADIFFPTDFDALCALYRATAHHVWGCEGVATGTVAPPPPPGTTSSSSGGVSAGGNLGDVNAEHFRQGAVIKRYREMFNTATICAFNPMVDDFVNARFFFGDSKDRYPPGQERPAPQASKPRIPQAPSSLVTAIKAHIPAAPAAKVRARLQQQGQPLQHQHQNLPQQQQQQEPVLGGRRQRGGLDGISNSNTSSVNSDSGSGSGSRGRGGSRK
ncbi:hypothetical protein Vretimale_15115 [Volvox reticuliferus]|uniref:type II protein arginine methyltransferase n=1 Tax=Volvox reticuliferus TaxID=1737510 RepID=A0A8J4C503_9CHLO|nr:hypothetical protein Vretifemale_5314 [Volvox reticuliferus]GIM11634.1 hypothetical protein Vretimale_15115 [Volvox reticuliferus]